MAHGKSSRNVTYFSLTRELFLKPASVNKWSSKEYIQESSICIRILDFVFSFCEEFKSIS